MEGLWWSYLESLALVGHMWSDDLGSRQSGEVLVHTNPYIQVHNPMHKPLAHYAPSETIYGCATSPIFGLGIHTQFDTNLQWDLAWRRSEQVEREKSPASYRTASIPYHDGMPQRLPYISSSHCNKQPDGMNGQPCASDK